MKTIKLTQGQVTIVDDIDYDFLRQWKWYVNLIGDHYRPLRNLPKENGKRKSLFIYTAIAERMGIDSTLIDHKDRNSLNNRRSNLRSATRIQNAHNCGPQSNSSTGVKGVCAPRKRDGKYRARITFGGKEYYLGDFNTVAEAEQAVITRRRELVGEFAAT